MIRVPRREGDQDDGGWSTTSTSIRKGGGVRETSEAFVGAHIHALRPTQEVENNHEWDRGARRRG